MTSRRAFEGWLFASMTLGLLSFHLAQSTVPIAVIAIGVAALGRRLVSRPGAKQPPRALLNALVMAAAAIAALTAIRDPEQFVGAIGGLLTWVQVVKQFEKPRIRDQAQVLIMSVFMSLSAMLTSNALIVGVLMLVHAPVIVWTAMLLQLEAGRRAATEQRDAPPAVHASPRARLHLRAALALSWLFAMAFSIGVYVVVPRGLGADVIGGEFSSPGAGAVSGFAQEVRLGQSGELSLSEDPVLDLVLLNDEGRNEGSANRAVLLRGAVLDTYDDRQHTWRSSGSARFITETASPLFPRSLAPPVGRAEVTSLRITIRNKQNDVIFSTNRPLSIAFDRETSLAWSPETREIRARRSGRVSYTVETQHAYSPAQGEDTAPLPPLFTDGPIRELTDSILADNELSRDPTQRHNEDDSRIARAIERHLQTNFTYTTIMTPPAPEEHPIEMFLFRTRQGHCEYFAAAMAAMCRSVGLEARVVAGYRASEFNDIAGHYVVRQSDAHSWVEVLVDQGLWRTYDPSPPDGVAAVGSNPTGALARARQVFDALEHAWVNWVVGFDEQARTALFGVPTGNLNNLLPHLDALTALTPAQIAVRFIRAALVGLAAFAITAAAGYLLAAAAAWLRRRLRRLRPRSASSGAMPAALSRQAAFYDALLRRLDRLGVPKPDWRPPLEHARSLATTDGELARAADALARLYYEVRFGARALTAAELDRAESLLRDIDRRAEVIGAARRPR